VALGTLAVGGLLAACSSSTPSAGPTTTLSTTTTSTSAPSGGGSTTAPGSSTTTTAASTNCQPAQLSGSVAAPSGAAGQIEESIVLQNTSSTTCTLSGYPGMQLYDGAGAAIPTTVIRGGETFLVPAANQPPGVVDVSPGAAADFRLRYEDVPVGGETSCPTSATALVTPPNDVHGLTMDLAVAPCGNGTVHVSPVYPG
jgi:hypothetical protein